jgi:hypothetical protein
LDKAISADRGFTRCHASIGIERVAVIAFFIGGIGHIDVNSGVTISTTGEDTGIETGVGIVFVAVLAGFVIWFAGI